MLDPAQNKNLSAKVGKDNALTTTDDIAPYPFEQRDLYNGRTPLVLRPASTQEVAQILKLAHETNTPVVPQGGNTGLVGAQTPDETGTAIVLALGRMNKIRSLDPIGNLVTVEAG